MDKLSFIGDYLNHIKENSLDLIDKDYKKQQLLMTGLSKGKKLLSGNITKQDIIDLCSIGIALSYNNKL